MTKKEDQIWLETLEKGQKAYIYDEFEEAVFKFEPQSRGGGRYVKFKGKKEYKAKEGSKLVYEATLGGKLIDEKFYNEF